MDNKPNGFPRNLSEATRHSFVESAALIAIWFAINLQRGPLTEADVQSGCFWFLVFMAIDLVLYALACAILAFGGAK